MEALDLSEQEGSITFRVRVAPRASRDQVLGVYAGALKVALTTAPVDGKANKALLKFLAKRLGVAPRDLKLVRGHTSREKTLRVERASVEALHQLASG